MSLSVIAEALLRAHLPEVTWQPLVAKFGYSMGFLAAIFGRQQLFTENTLTAVLPVMQNRNLSTLIDLSRLWAVVLAGNIAGCLMAGTWLAWTDSFDDQVRAAFLEIGREALAVSWGDAVVRGIVAGWIIALIVWMLPFAEAGRFFVIVALTYVVGLGGLTHVVAGSIEAFIVAASGERNWLGVIGAYTAPALLGNIIGGVMLTAALNHAQVVAGDTEENEAKPSSDPPAGDPG